MVVSPEALARLAIVRNRAGSVSALKAIGPARLFCLSATPSKSLSK
jgi:hypothetical protein